jgi:hypothetical protein
MVLQNTGPIKFTEIQTEFGGVNPISLSEYYSDSTYASNVPNIPTSYNRISLSMFYNTRMPYIVHRYTSGTNTLTLTRNSICDILLVGGGGGGGNYGTYTTLSTRQVGGGGGGGGGIVYQQNVRMNSGTYSIIIGTGGTAVTTANNSSTNGGNTLIRFNSLTYTNNGINYIANGGGAGANSTVSPYSGLAGGSSGGNSFRMNPQTQTAPTQGATFYDGTTNIIGGSSGNIGYQSFLLFFGGNGGSAPSTININIISDSDQIIYAQGGLGGKASLNQGDEGSVATRTTPGSGGSGGSLSNSGTTFFRYNPTNGIAGIAVIRITGYF